MRFFGHFFGLRGQKIDFFVIFGGSGALPGPGTGPPAGPPGRGRGRARGGPGRGSGRGAPGPWGTAREARKPARNPGKPVRRPVLGPPRGCQGPLDWVEHPTDHLSSVEHHPGGRCQS